MTGSPEGLATLEAVFGLAGDEVVDEVGGGGEAAAVADELPYHGYRETVVRAANERGGAE
jgi:hypothetical protein